MFAVNPKGEELKCISTSKVSVQTINLTTDLPMT